MHNRGGYVLGLHRVIGDVHAGDLEEVGLDRSGVDACHLDAVVAELLHDGGAEAADAEFCGVVGADVRVAEQARDGCDVYDVSAKPAVLVLGLHRRYSRFGAEEDAADVRFHQRIPGVGVKLLHRPEFAESGVVDEDVDASGGVDNRLEGAGDGVLVAHVARNGVEGIAELVANSLHLVEAAGESEYGGAPVDEVFRKLFADAAAGSGHDGNAISHVHRKRELEKRGWRESMLRFVRKRAHRFR